MIRGISALIVGGLLASAYGIYLIACATGKDRVPGLAPRNLSPGVLFMLGLLLQLVLPAAIGFVVKFCL